MKRIVILSLVFALLTPVAIFAAATEEAGGMAEPVVLNWNLGADPKYLDPGLNGATDGSDIANNTFEGLTRERSGEVFPGIAERWDVSSNGLVYTFHLRDSKWSDGSDLTARDFEYAWKRAIDPATASEYGWLWEYTNVVNSMEANAGEADLEDVGIKAIDDNTLRVTLKAPTEYFVSLMSFTHFMPVKRSAVEAGAEGSWAKTANLYVSNGPFYLTSYKVGDGLTLERNPYYWAADEVGIDIINVKFIDVASTAYTAYQSGDFDFLNDMPPAEIPKLLAENPEFYAFPYLGTYYYNFNMTLPQWQDVRIRRAMTLAIDREAISEVFGDGRVPAAGFVPPGLPDERGRDFFETAGNYGIPTDDSAIAEAKQLLAQAGYPNGAGFPSFVLMYNTSEGHQLVAEMVQEMWKTNLGITCTLENQEWAVFQDTRKEGDYEVARGGWITDFVDPIGLLAIFKTGNTYNDPKYNNPAYDAAIERAANSAGAAHYEALYEAQDILMTDLPIIPVYHYTDTLLSSPQVKNWDRSLLGSLDFSQATVVR